jgi:hypothetical protein
MHGLGRRRTNQPRARPGELVKCTIQRRYARALRKRRQRTSLGSGASRTRTGDLLGAIQEVRRSS